MAVWEFRNFGKCKSKSAITAEILDGLARSKSEI
jgi:hypothetical protein